MSSIILYAMVVGGCALGAFASYYFKKASGRLEGAAILALAREKAFWAGGLLYLVAAVNNIFLLGYLDYSVLLPMSSITYIWTMIVAYKLLGERITARKIVGVAAIVCGAVLLAGS
ncbi:MAG: multidrug transporter [Clostridiales bacterium]|nr:multidrug transporter [Clostridiales bacterium]